jgi:hypothetical protein
MSDQTVIQFILMIVAGITLIGTMWKGTIFLFANQEKRAQKLTDELITAKTVALMSKIELLTTKLDRAAADLASLKIMADQLRVDLDSEKTLRDKETTRATRAELLEMASRKELERRQIEVETLKSVLKMLAVSIPEGSVQINIIRTPEQRLTTDELTESAKKVVDELKHV